MKFGAQCLQFRLHFDSRKFAFLQDVSNIGWLFLRLGFSECLSSVSSLSPRSGWIPCVLRLWGESKHFLYLCSEHRACETVQKTVDCRIDYDAHFCKCKRKIHSILIPTCLFFAYAKHEEALCYTLQSKEKQKCEGDSQENPGHLAVLFVTFRFRWSGFIQSLHVLRAA